MNAFSQLMAEYEKSEHVRLGQMFINNYFKGTWPELYYEKDDNKAKVIIYQFMYDNQWFNDDLRNKRLSRFKTK